MLDIEYAELTDTGKTREHNEDSLGHVIPATTAEVQSQGWLFAIADGVGGQEHGEIASRLAIDTVVSGFRKIPKGIMHVSLLPRLVQEANAAVYDAATAGPSRGQTSRMGTTLVACALRFDSAVVSHVGDSRCYLYREGVGIQLTSDHTMAANRCAWACSRRTMLSPVTIVMYSLAAWVMNSSSLQIPRLSMSSLATFCCSAQTASMAMCRRGRFSN